MQLLSLTLPTPEENLALDEALLEAAESPGGDETLRFWESPRPVAVIGRSSRAADEVNLDSCRRLGVPVLRRASGGAAIVAGPGCLMYALALSLHQRPELQAIDRAHSFVLDRIAAALSGVEPSVARDGTSDLVIRGVDPPRKVSGNSVRIKRGGLLYHGTLLYNFDLKQIGSLLRTPPRQPGYRAGRPHEAFVANLASTPDVLRDSIAHAWDAEPEADVYPRKRVDELVDERYGNDAWNFAR